MRTPPFLGPCSRTALGPMVVLGGGGVSYEQGTPADSARDAWGRRSVSGERWGEARNHQEINTGVPRS